MPMSTKPFDPNKSNTTRATEQLLPLTEPAPMTREKLEQCDGLLREPRDHEQCVFAVAYRHGLVQDLDADHEHEAMFVLYATADGEQMVLEAIPAGHEQFERVPRISVASDEALKPTNDEAARFAPIVQKHPEV